MKLLSEITLEVDEMEIRGLLDALPDPSGRLSDKDLLKRIFSLIDLTSLSERDNSETIENLCDKINLMVEAYPSIPNVAAICVFPELLSTVKMKLENPLVNVASVGGGFPSSQTFTEIKLKEIELALELGADEIDIVLPVGKFLLDDLDLIHEEIHAIKEVLGTKHLKVILETGSLMDFSLIRKASFLAMLSGADFIKTSTGKVSVGATYEAVAVMSLAIKDYYNKTGKKIGIKPAGGISDALTSIRYYQIVENILGEEWLNAERFRIGASRLANSLMAEILEKDENFKYF
jgi:deoxyribose-phosphate aldolase